MPTLSPEVVFILVICALLCGLAKTALPGLACIPVAILAAVMPTRTSTALMLLMLLTGDLLAVWTYRKDVDWKVLRALFPPVVIGVLIGAAFLATVSNQVMKVSIGIIILILTAITLGLIWYARRSGRDLATSMSTSLPARLFYGSLSGFTTMAAVFSGGFPMTSKWQGIIPWQCRKRDFPIAWRYLPGQRTVRLWRCATEIIRWSVYSFIPNPSTPSMVSG